MSLERRPSTWSDRTWSRVARQGWGYAIGRPYSRVEIPGGPGLIVYATLATFVAVTPVVVLGFLGLLG